MPSCSVGRFSKPASFSTTPGTLVGNTLENHGGTEKNHGKTKESHGEKWEVEEILRFFGKELLWVRKDDGNIYGNNFVGQPQIPHLVR